jgi:hypothetical protein
MKGLLWSASFAAMAWSTAPVQTKQYPAGFITTRFTAQCRANSAST